jgi:hypothetical protein
MLTHVKPPVMLVDSPHQVGFGIEVRIAILNRTVAEYAIRLAEIRGRCPTTANHGYHENELHSPEI